VEGEIKLKERMNDVIKELAERRRQMDEFEARLSEAIVLSLSSFTLLGNRTTEFVWDYGQLHPHSACALSRRFKSD
jgi:hypothetical protein